MVEKTLEELKKENAELVEKNTGLINENLGLKKKISEVGEPVVGVKQAGVVTVKDAAKHTAEVRDAEAREAAKAKKGK